MIYLRKLVPVQRNVASSEKKTREWKERKGRRRIWENRREEDRTSWESHYLEYLLIHSLRLNDSSYVLAWLLKDVTSVHDFHFLRKREKKRSRDEGKIYGDDAHEANGRVRNATRAREGEIGRQKTMGICGFLKYNTTWCVFRRVWVWCFGVRAAVVYSRELCLREESEFFSRRDVRSKVTRRK